jgi:ADP-heptose:LPS heptosyltransferase
VRCLKLQLNAQIHFLTKKGFAQILESNPYIEKVYTITKSVSEVVAVLQAEKYDHIIDLHKNLRSTELQLRLGKKARSFNKANLSKWLMTSLLKSKLKIEHVVYRYLQAVTPLGVVYDGAGLDYFIQANQWSDYKKDETYLAVAIGGTYATKRLPEAKIIEICQAVQVPIVLLGGKDDEAVGSKVAEVLDHVTSLCGLLLLNESAQVIERASVVVAHDTGLMHIAAALKKPIISVWGNTVPGFGMNPFYPNDNKPLSYSAEVNDLPCRPCSKIGFDRCPQGHFRCMEFQQVVDIVANTQLLLSSITPD